MNSRDFNEEPLKFSLQAIFLALRCTEDCTRASKRAAAPSTATPPTSCTVRYRFADISVCVRINQFRYPPNTCACFC